MSPLLAELYKFAWGIAGGATADQLLSRFRFGLLFLTGRFGFLYEALPRLPEKNPHQKPKQKKRQAKILAAKDILV